MKQISYSGVAFVTTDRVSAALLELTAKLGSTNSTMTVEVPAYHPGAESPSGIGMVIGPASEIASMTAEWGTADPDDDDEVITALSAQARSLLVAKPIPVDPTDPPVVLYPDDSI